MAGVLFIICVPCERYEHILVNKNWETTPVKQTRDIQQIPASSSDEEINYYFNSKVRKKTEKPRYKFHASSKVS